MHGSMQSISLHALVNAMECMLKCNERMFRSSASRGRPLRLRGLTGARRDSGRRTEMVATRDVIAPERADLIVRNAKVSTLRDGDGATAEAVAVRGERFAAVGGETEVMRLAGERTTVVDAGGRRVIPGLNDSHLH